MIKVTVLYPNEEGKKFDQEYYMNSHIPMVHRLFDPVGMVRVEIDKGVSGPDPSAPPAFIMIGHLYFNTVEEVHTAFTTHAKEVMGDIPNYTDIQPQIQISEVLE